MSRRPSTLGVIVWVTFGAAVAVLSVGFIIAALAVPVSQDGIDLIKSVAVMIVALFAIAVLAKVGAIGMRIPENHKGDSP